MSALGGGGGGGGGQSFDSRLLGTAARRSSARCEAKLKEPEERWRAITLDANGSDHREHPRSKVFGHGLFQAGARSAGPRGPFPRFFVEELPGSARISVAEGMRYATDGGKRLRGFFLRWKPRRCSTWRRGRRCFAAGPWECLHAYSLVHDDLPCMDDDDLAPRAAHRPCDMGRGDRRSGGRRAADLRL